MTAPAPTYTRSVCGAVTRIGLWRDPVECGRDHGHDGPHVANRGAGWAWSR